MADNFYQTEDLILKYLKKELTVPEEQSLQEWLAASVKNKELFEQLTDAKILEEKLQLFHTIEAGKEQARSGLVTSQPVELEIPVRKIFSWKKIAIAASIVLVIGFGSYLFFSKPAKKEQIVKTQEQRFKNDVTPGSDRAVLIMADGREVVLEGTGEQTLTEKDGSRIANVNGSLSYDDKSIKPAAVIYHTLRIPRKGEYELMLADGSTVKLNSESSLYYPTAFAGRERKVEITGEAYFNIAKDAGKPFIVSVNGVDIKVLGTQFNVNAYANETTIRTTLVEGSVEVTKAGQTVIIKPGQQARVKGDGELEVNNVKVDEVTAWTTGYFQFNSTDIESIMRQVARWYDVDVVFEEKTEQRFNGKIPRSVNVSDIFKILESTGWVHFSIDGKKVRVTK